MDVTGILIAILLFGLVGYGAYWIIMRFFKEPFQTPVLAVVGVVLLIVLISYIGGYLPAGHGIAIR